MAHTNSRYITTPIYYVTAKPHLGSLYSTLIADVLTRWYQLRGKETFFLTGTDEHGQKIAEAAQSAGKEPKAFVDSFIDAYKDAWHTYHIDYSHFIRTTDTAHVKAVQAWIQQLIDKGDIYKAFYEGWYCVPCETFVTDTEIKEQKKADKEPHCPSCHRAVEQVKEETYFFRLSAYQDRLLALYKDHPDFIVPKERANEVINFVSAGLKDLSISRRTVKWGIPFPGDDAHVAYVWADALNNYITAIGWGQKGREKEFAFWWPAAVQVLGKDIVRFHAIYWPAFLMASGLSAPKQLLVHGWIQVDKKKMSKSLGNVIDPMVLAKAYGPEPVRYYLMRHMAITQDSNFTIADLEATITSDLANDLGNLLNRMTSLAEKHDAMHVKDPELWSEAALEVVNESWNVIEDYTEYMREKLFHMALGRVWKFVHTVNAYFHAHEPWKLAKTDRAAFMEVLSVVCHSLRVIATLAWPVMPKKMEELLASIGVVLKTEAYHDAIEDLELSWKGREFMLKKIAALFTKPEPKKEAPAQPAVAAKEATAEQGEHISIDDLIKVELLVGTITQAEVLPKSDKLLVLSVDFGPKGQRQILAGIRASYAPEDIIGKQAVFVTNLKPRKMMGLESQGMMLVSKDEQGNVKITMPAAPVPNGSRLS